MCLDTNYAAALADAGLNAPFFGQAELGPIIANLPAKDRTNTKYEKALIKIFSDHKVHEYAQRNGAKAYEKFAEYEIFKNTQSVNSGEAKDAQTLKREHKR